MVAIRHAASLALQAGITQTWLTRPMTQFQPDPRHPWVRFAIRGFPGLRVTLNARSIAIRSVACLLRGYRERSRADIWHAASLARQAWTTQTWLTRPMTQFQPNPRHPWVRFAIRGFPGSRVTLNAPSVAIRSVACLLRGDRERSRADIWHAASLARQAWTTQTWLTRPVMRFQPDPRHPWVRFAIRGFPGLRETLNARSIAIRSVACLLRGDRERSRADIWHAASLALQAGTTQTWLTRPVTQFQPNPRHPWVRFAIRGFPGLRATLNSRSVAIRSVTCLLRGYRERSRADIWHAASLALQAWITQTWLTRPVMQFQPNPRHPWGRFAIRGFPGLRVTLNAPSVAIRSVACLLRGYRERSRADIWHAASLARQAEIAATLSFSFCVIWRVEGSFTAYTRSDG